MTIAVTTTTTTVGSKHINFSVNRFLDMLFIECSGKTNEIWWRLWQHEIVTYTFQLCEISSQINTMQTRGVLFSHSLRVSVNDVIGLRSLTRQVNLFIVNHFRSQYQLELGKYFPCDCRPIVNKTCKLFSGRSIFLHVCSFASLSFSIGTGCFASDFIVCLFVLTGFLWLAQQNFSYILYYLIRMHTYRIINGFLFWNKELISASMRMRMRSHSTESYSIIQCKK